MTKRQQIEIGMISGNQFFYGFYQSEKIFKYKTHTGNDGIDYSSRVRINDIFRAGKLVNFI